MSKCDVFAINIRFRVLSHSDQENKILSFIEPVVTVLWTEPFQEPTVVMCILDLHILQHKGLKGPLRLREFQPYVEVRAI